ncbi:MAG: DUF2235 domain-containing protein [Proteobacteria bacterium]|nr:DUF2235 domain-containing protein [Pseudomonadota bacterium]
MSKNIILCFDGTCNDPEDSIQTVHALGSVEDQNITNVLKLHLLLGGNLKGKVDVSDQMSFYYSGVGTYGNLFQRLRNMLKAPEREDVGTIIKRAIKDIYTYFKPGDQLFVFGFSRGSAIARRFVAVLKNTLPALGMDVPEIRFMGVFDTVAAINKPNLTKKDILPASDVVFENQTISPLIKEALHIVSLDERRVPFFPTLMNRDGKRVTEIWFPGVHADIGGGFHYDGLSDLSLQFMLDEFVRRDLKLKILTPASVNFSDLFDDDKDEVIEYRDLAIQPNHMGKCHQQHAITFIKEAFLGHRCPRVNVNDKQSVYSPLIHHSVFDRMVDNPEYDPTPLRSHMMNSYTGGLVKFRVWYGPGQEVEYDNLLDAKLSAVHQPAELNKGEGRQFSVYANQRFSSSRILVTKGKTYRFEINPDQLWYDGDIPATPLGWKKKNKKDMAFYTKLFIKSKEDNRRHPEAEWFEVIGTVSRNETSLIRITQFTNTPWKASESGVFYAFPNDLVSKYGNNLGSIQVTITRVD